MIPKYNNFSTILYESLMMTKNQQTLLYGNSTLRKPSKHSLHQYDTYEHILTFQKNKKELFHTLFSIGVWT